MKRSLSRLSYILFILALSAGAAYSQCAPLMSFLLPYHGEKTRADMVMQNNELEPKATGHNKIFSCNPLLLNGEPLEYELFSIKSKGLLSLAEGAPASASAPSIPFRVYLRRDGNIVENEKTAAFCKPLLKVEISDILSQSKTGDQLLIVPVNAEDWKAKRILKIMDLPDGC